MSASLERGLDRFREALDADTASFFATCVRCGMCAEACLFYTETKEPKYTPIHKLQPLKRLWWREYTLLGRIAAAVGLSKPVTDAELSAWSELVYDSCTLCGRCSLICPVGNDITYMIRRMRDGMAAAGHAPPGLVGATRRAIELGSPMGVTLATLQAQIRHQEEATGIPIPMDVQGAEYLVLLSSMEIVNNAEVIGAVARIFHQAGITWTLASDAFEATNSGIQIGVSELAKEIVLRTVTAAERLGVRAVVSPECGHAYMALRWEGPDLIGRPYRFEVLHILELLDRLRAAGKLKLASTFDLPITFHDPCQIVRRGGVIDAPRNLLNLVATDVREMHDHGVYNWCCGGGGGVSASGRAEELRLTAFNKKRGQIEATGAKVVATACANCRMVMEEAIDHYQMGVELKGLTELIADHLEQETPEVAA
ncbi:MAG: heterodisulfide reductase [Nitrospirae bacterium CG18_big_fil_WC_8_21_14_2_50_70_55]|nr:(Fe-S)-binding protein [Deltaproteobacteria bacterium]OIP63933.1 MAG: heterodisulfide reductase [Nitrospirae bacterium CG2_30_70_394]PIQ05387.1 MAG: heterodisulfide reductase [Nitrospirae bacterium CG18_big_fil_WC_8_21_14_2_50_70_55]PIW83508.1 MAG: heterodisulfide reductase [Nitrospirae bacterium CG_4_8_14_3_um_filter_70_85]PIX83513.1 MAG: heterodisulfide reductase [Nitrospirae bacterium CG_4_10_14_3_um_filter_70_108]